MRLSATESNLKLKGVLCFPWQSVSLEDLHDSSTAVIKIQISSGAFFTPAMAQSYDIDGYDIQSLNPYWWRADAIYL